ncbi:hypothetical protein AT00_08510 [Pseudoalteromonas lipolytica SCSIO 04301]|uniref:DUF58 domain-containing protein n=1 Tax=Pseudoalteromonas lipolytica TaxID=570156 RepID=UPI00044DA1B9|nr:DUF58 domain-containing protein [Pseudoalteromonas lipolytica]EWH06622.1 hypothetical protein AT00_08510 [Pseudoalteromonas lipolytica SCSIO 04301]
MIRIKLRPAKRLVLLLCAVVLMVLVCAIAELGSVIMTALLLVPVVITWIDLIASKSQPLLSTELSTSQNMALYRWQPVQLTINNTAKQPLLLDASLHLSQAIELAEPQQTVFLTAMQQAQLSFNIRAHKRGDADITAIELRVGSSFGLWQSSWLVKQETRLKVYPDFSRVTSKQHLNGVTNKPINGLKLTKKRGEGIEFHQLREYRQGDSVRQIDWQATSKRRKLISREYQEEQNQHVIVMLDASKKMAIEANEGTHFDHALNALLLLAHTVLKQGDWFSMQSFNQALRWLPDVKGAQNVSRVMNHFYDLYPDNSSSDYLVAVNQLIAKRTKRSLVLLVTTLDEQSIDELLPAIKMLQKHHLVALININNRAVAEVLDEPIEKYEDATSYCAALALLNAHKANMAKLKKQGVIAIDCKPAQLLPHVLNTYLNVKHSGAL